MIKTSLMLVCLICITACSRQPHELVSETLSPDKKLKAVIHIVRAGSINTDVINVSIVDPADPTPRSGGNVFSSYMPQDLNVAWSNASSLVITLDSWKYGTSGKRNVRGVDIRYIPEEPTYTVEENLDAAKETAKQLMEDIRSR